MGTLQRMAVEAIRVGKPYRKTMDLTGLTESIAQHGLLHPPVLDEEGTLLSGSRRLAVLRKLGIEVVDVQVVDTLDDAYIALTTERGPHQRPMLPSELIAQAELLFNLGHREIQRRMAAGYYARTRKNDPLPPGAKPGKRSYRTHERVAALYGIGATRFAALRFVWKLSIGELPDGWPVDPGQQRLGIDALARIDVGESPQRHCERLRAQLVGRPLRTPTFATKPKTAKEPEPAGGARKPRKPLLDQLDAATVRLCQAVTTIERLLDDDRWPVNRKKVAPSTRHDLLESARRMTAAVTKLQDPESTEEST
jgi:hypothetical protein